MPEKKSSVRKNTADVPDATAAAAKADDKPVVQPASKSPGQAGAPKQGEGQEPAPEPAATPPAVTPAAGKSAAVRMMTRSVAGKKPAAARGESQRVADAAKPSQKPVAGGGRRGPRRGASKGR
jgi:hypothetical protein